MRNAVALSLVMALLLSWEIGCSRSEKSNDFAILDQAYKTGVLSKDEYEAKRAALEAQSKSIDALDKALATGAISQPQYQATKARLISRESLLASLENAREAGILTQEEFLAKKAALLSSDSDLGASALPDKEATPAAPAVPYSTNSNSSAAVVSVSMSEALLTSQPGFKSVRPPQGGTILYGPVQGQTTEAGAMGAVLRALHNQLGDRPQVGKLFQVRGTESVAAFFSVKNKKSAGTEMAGLLIAAKVTSDHVEVALVSDDAARFPKTLSPMMKTLVGVWHPLSSSGASKAEPSSAPAPLHQITLQDRSASIGLPDGWKIVPNMSTGGTIVASGPNGESAEMGITFLIGDTNNPNVQRTLQTLRNGGLRNSSYAKATYYPYGGDMAKTFVYLLQNLRHKAGLSQASYNFKSVSAVPASAPQRCVRLSGTANFGDNKGERELNAVFCTTPPNRFGSWSATAYMTTLPAQVAARERPTMGAIMQSFNVNMSVVNAEAQRMAAPAIAQIHAIGQASANQAAAAHEREDIHNSSVYQHWDAMDKRSQEFENYQLGYSVISDTGNNVHGTFWNEDAAALVESNPDKFEYVSAPNYWKGVDY